MKKEIYENFIRKLKKPVHHHLKQEYRNKKFTEKSGIETARKFIMSKGVPERGSGKMARNIMNGLKR